LTITAAKDVTVTGDILYKTSARHHNAESDSRNTRGHFNPRKRSWAGARYLHGNGRRPDEQQTIQRQSGNRRLDRHDFARRHRRLDQHRQSHRYSCTYGRPHRESGQERQYNDAEHLLRPEIFAKRFRAALVSVHHGAIERVKLRDDDNDDSADKMV